MKKRRLKEGSAGFSLIELIISVSIVLVAILALGGLLGLSIINSDKGRQITLAKFIAVTTLESITIARDSSVIVFDDLTSTKFPTTKGPVKGPGADNIYGTTDDSGNLVYINGPQNGKATGTFDNVNDQKLDLTQAGYQRQITFTDIAAGVRQIDVTVFYPSRIGTSTFSVRTVVAQYPTSLQ